MQSLTSCGGIGGSIPQASFGAASTGMGTTSGMGTSSAATLSSTLLFDGGSTAGTASGACAGAAGSSLAGPDASASSPVGMGIQVHRRPDRNSAGRHRARSWRHQSPAGHSDPEPIRTAVDAGDNDEPLPDDRNVSDWRNVFGLLLSDTFNKEDASATKDSLFPPVCWLPLFADRRWFRGHAYILVRTLSACACRCHAPAPVVAGMVASTTCRSI